LKTLEYINVYMDYIITKDFLMYVVFFIKLALLATNKTNKVIKNIRKVIISIVMVKKMFFTTAIHTK